MDPDAQDARYAYEDRLEAELAKAREQWDLAAKDAAKFALECARLREDRDGFERECNARAANIDRLREEGERAADAAFLLVQERDSLREALDAGLMYGENGVYWHARCQAAHLREAEKDVENDRLRARLKQENADSMEEIRKLREAIATRTWEEGTKLVWYSKRLEERDAEIAKLRAHFPCPLSSSFEEHGPTAEGCKCNPIGAPCGEN